MITKVSTVLFSILVLFLISKTFWNLFRTILNRVKCDEESFSVDQEQLFTVEKIRPMIFVKFFATCLTIPFLSHYILSLARADGFSVHLASLAYVTYTVIFIFMIIPSGYLVEVKNLKATLLLMLLFEALIFIVFGLSSSFLLVFILQAFFGFIVPISSSAEYAYIFSFSNEMTRNQALALYANTVRGAMIAGVFSGGVLLSVITAHEIFIMSSVLVFCCFLYVLFFIPKINCSNSKCRAQKTDIMTIFRSLPFLFKDIDFILASIFVSFPLGFITEGIILFCLPILLAKSNIPHPLVGQIIVLFSIGFFITNRFIAKKADKYKKEKRYIVFGIVGIAFAIALISFFDKNSVLGFCSLILGLFALGIFRGFMLSPSIALVSKSFAADVVGKNVAVSVYRLFEALGKAAGPLLISYLLISSGFSTRPFLVMSAAFLLIACLFVFVWTYAKRG